MRFTLLLSFYLYISLSYICPARAFLRDASASCMCDLTSDTNVRSYLSCIHTGTGYMRRERHLKNALKSVMTSVYYMLQTRFLQLICNVHATGWKLITYVEQIIRFCCNIYPQFMIFIQNFSHHRWSGEVLPTSNNRWCYCRRRPLSMTSTHTHMQYNTSKHTHTHIRITLRTTH